jgi:hypothetical protein
MQQIYGRSPSGKQYKLDPEDVLKSNRIEVRQDSRYYTVCPRCSAKRKPEHQKIKCLGVTRPDDNRVYWGCNHCHWTGPGAGRGTGILRPSEHKRPESKTWNFGPSTRTLYNYTDKLRKVKVVRSDGIKKVWWEHKSKGWWEKGSSGTNLEHLLYRLHTAKKMARTFKLPICIAEGEKDVDHLMFNGFPATCNAHGASEPGKNPKWYEAHSAQLNDWEIAVFNDNDAAGIAHREAICALSAGVSARVVVVDQATHFPGCKDVSDWFKAGGDAQTLRDFIEGAPEYGA